MRITTQLVQVDAIVTDKKGQHIEDLSEDDFELTVDGKPQPLTFFKLIRLVAPKTAKAVPAKGKTPPLTQMPTKQVDAENVRRTIALVVDDLGLSFASTHFAKEALKRFVAEQMEEGDLVGIIRTSKGFGIYQQFTSDKRILYAAIDKLQFEMFGRKPIPFDLGWGDDPLTGRNDVFQTPSEKLNEQLSRRSPDFSSKEDPKEAVTRDAELQKEAADAKNRDVNEFRNNNFSYGTLGALNYVVRALRPLPGRKVAVILSDGLPLRMQMGGNDTMEILRQIQRLAELANRSSVAFYSIDVEGIKVPYFGNASSSGAPEEPLIGIPDGELDGLRLVAEKTGGLALFNNNNTEQLLKRAIDDNRSYYLIGFDPDDEKFDRKHHNIKLHVKRPGLLVRTRDGFFGIEESKIREIPKTREAQILSALFSPFGAKDIPYQVSSLFFSTLKGEPVIRSYFHIDCSKLKFKDEENGKKSLTLELANFTFNEAGVVVESYARSFTVQFDEARYRQALAEGLTYLNDFPVKKPGAYQFRSALRDANSGMLGSSNQFIQIPDLKKDRTVLSGIILNLVGNPEMPAPASSADQGGDVLNAKIQANPAARRFATNSELEYQAAIYNPRLDKQTGKPSLKLQFELYRDGKPIFQSPIRPVRSDRQTDPKWLDCGGRFQLKNFAAGNYLLRLVVKDELRDGRNAFTEQWIDFTVR